MKPRRNDPCSCGSGKKFKHCCLGKTEFRSQEPSPDQFKQLAALFSTGRYAELESRTRTLLGQYPDSGFAWKLLGESLHMQGKIALEAFQKAAELMPDDAAVRYNLGVVFTDIGKLDDAVASYRMAVNIKPDFALAHNNLGYLLQTLGQTDTALESCRRALQIQPDLALAHNNLGNSLQSLGQLEAAQASFQRALQIKPDFAEAHNNLGYLQQVLGQPNAARASFQRALQIKPDFAEAHNNLGITLQHLGLFEGALASYRRALEIKPEFVAAQNNLGSALKDLGQIQGALASYRRALEIEPSFIDAHSNLLFALNYTSSLTSAYCLEQARQFGRLVADRVEARFSAWQCAAIPERLRVGLVSGDLRKHPVGHFLEALLAHIDQARIELVAYPTNHEQDELTARIRPCFSAWKPLIGKSDEAVARMIHADGVHILIDLSGHTGHNRLPVFAWKPAPVQVTWLGYFATTGIAEMDYLLADKVGVPEIQRNQFTECVWYLPDTRLCFTAPLVDLPVTSLPAHQNGFITFGCFQSLAKLDDQVLAAWGEIFAALPDARLRIQCKQLGEPAQAEQLAKRLLRYNIIPERVTMHGQIHREAYLAAHAEVDLILDTFPFSGGTTTCEALWMGVPTLTLAGESLPARQGASLLMAAGLEEWVATSIEDYVDKAITLAGDKSRLAALRAGLRQQVLASPLFDAPRFALNLEDALWEMWQTRIQSYSSTQPELPTASRD